MFRIFSGTSDAQEIDEGVFSIHRYTKRASDGLAVTYCIGAVFVSSGYDMNFVLVDPGKTNGAILAGELSIPLKNISSFGGYYVEGHYAFEEFTGSFAGVDFGSVDGEKLLFYKASYVLHTKLNKAFKHNDQSLIGQWYHGAEVYAAVNGGNLGDPRVISCSEGP